MENIPVFYGDIKPYDTTKPPIRQPLNFTWILGLGSRWCAWFTTATT